MYFQTMKQWRMIMNKLSRPAKALLTTLNALLGAVKYNPNQDQINRIKEWVPELCRMKSVPIETKQQWIKISESL